MYGTSGDVISVFEYKFQYQNISIWVFYTELWFFSRLHIHNQRSLGCCNGLQARLANLYDCVAHSFVLVPQLHGKVTKLLHIHIFNYYNILELIMNNNINLLRKTSH